MPGKGAIQSLQDKLFGNLYMPAGMVTGVNRGNFSPAAMKYLYGLAVIR